MPDTYFQGSIDMGHAWAGTVLNNGMISTKGLSTYLCVLRHEAWMTTESGIPGGGYSRVIKFKVTLTPTNTRSQK